MKRTNIYLGGERTASLDRLAGQGVSRADLASDLTAIEESFGVLAGMGTADRRTGGREAQLDRMWRRRR